MDRINDHIIEQIIAFYLGEISDKDKKELEAWVNEFKENEDDFKQILRKCQHLRLGLLEERAIVMKARIMEEWRKRERLKYRHRVLRLVSCVAILVLGIVMGCVYYESRNFESKKLEQEISLLDAKQGERVAVLQLASGEKWILKERDERELEIGDGVVDQLAEGLAEVLEVAGNAGEKLLAVGGVVDVSNDDLAHNSSSKKCFFENKTHGAGRCPTSCGRILQHSSCPARRKRVYCPYRCGESRCVGGRITCAGAKELQLLCTAVFFNFYEQYSISV